MVSTSSGSLSKYLEANQTELGDMVLAHERQFVVPLNQRPWAWKDPKNVQSLLDDFENILGAFFDQNSKPKWKKINVERPPHFFGTFVFYKRSAKEFEIFDGQQRLTATMMLCAALREIANEAMAVAGPHKMRAQGAYAQINNWLLSDTGKLRPRLVPNVFFHSLFGALIFESLDEGARQTALEKLPQGVTDHDITKKLIKSFDHIRTWTRNKVDGCTLDDKTNFLIASQEVLSKLFCCIETVIKSEPYSYEVFECLNARGVSLTHADRIKNNLFSATDKDNHKSISDLWTEIGKNVDDQDIGEFLRRRHIALYGPCKKDDVHPQIKTKEIEPASDVKGVVEGWHDDSARVRAIMRAEPGVGSEETRNRLVIIFDILDAGLAYVPLLAASKRFLPNKKADFSECVTAVEKFIFRLLTIQQIDTSDLERKLGEAARILSDGKSVSDFKAYLQKQSDDDGFREAFSKHVQRRAVVQYYILRQLETALLGGGKGLIPGDHDTAKNHVEHILPKRLCTQADRKHEWGWARANPDRHKGLVNRLGNLLILEGNINKNVGNHEFEVKRTGAFKKKSGKVKTFDCYKDSALPSPKGLCDSKTWPDWTADDIEKRQIEMSKQALVVWKL